MRNACRTGLVLLLLAGCAGQDVPILGPGTGDEVAQATSIGGDVGDIGCTGLLLAEPDERDTLVDVVTKGQVALANPDLTAAALQQLLSDMSTNDQSRLYVAGVRVVMRRLQARGIDITNLAPDSPARAALVALFDSCALAAGITTAPPPTEGSAPGVRLPSRIGIS